MFLIILLKVGLFILIPITNHSETTKGETPRGRRCFSTQKQSNPGVLGQVALPSVPVMMRGPWPSAFSVLTSDFLRVRTVYKHVQTSKKQEQPSRTMKSLSKNKHVYTQKQAEQEPSGSFRLKVKSLETQTTLPGPLCVIAIECRLPSCSLGKSSSLALDRLGHKTKGYR